MMKFVGRFHDGEVKFVGRFHDDKLHDDKVCVLRTCGSLAHVHVTCSLKRIPYSYEVKQFSLNNVFIIKVCVLH